MATTIRVESVRGRRHGGSSIDPYGGPNKLLANGRRFAFARGGGGKTGGKRRAKEARAWKREHAINTTADTCARARQLNRTKTHLRAAPGIFVLDERAVFRIRTSICTVGCVNDVRGHVGG